jgi:hypothetical protein
MSVPDQRGHPACRKRRLDDGIAGIGGIGGGTARGYGTVSVRFGDPGTGGIPAAAEGRRVLTEMLEEP